MLNVYQLMTAFLVNLNLHSQIVNSDEKQNKGE